MIARRASARLSSVLRGGNRLTKTSLRVDGRFDLGPDLEFVLRPHAQQAEQLASGRPGDVGQRPDEMLRSRHQPMLYVLAIVDHEVDHVGDPADRDQQAGARRRAIDEDLVAARPRQRNDAFELAFLPIHAADEAAQQFEGRRGIGPLDRAGDGHGLLLCDEGDGAAAEHVSAPVRNMESEALQHVFGQRLREVADVLFPEDGRAAERKALLHLGQLQHQKPVRPKQRPERLEEARRDH